jgi:hypothetical protein
LIRKSKVGLPEASIKEKFTEEKSNPPYFSLFAVLWLRIISYPLFNFFNCSMAKVLVGSISIDFIKLLFASALFPNLT